MRRDTSILLFSDTKIICRETLAKLTLLDIMSVNQVARYKINSWKSIAPFHTKNNWVENLTEKKTCSTKTIALIKYLEINLLKKQRRKKI